MKELSKKRKRNFRPSKALMKDAFLAAREAGYENVRLDLKPGGGFSVTAYGRETNSYEADEWDRAIAEAK